MKISKLNQIKAVMLGHAVGDALGVPVEFSSRESLDECPVTDMKGFGTFPVPAGAWSDDTSMSLCAIDALANDNFNYELVMKNFGQWYYNDKYTPTGTTFDVGNTCSKAIENYFIKKKDINHCGLKGKLSNGNGSLMRIHPFVLFCFYEDDIYEPERMWDTVCQASEITHGHIRAQVGCAIYAMMLSALLETHDKTQLFRSIDFVSTKIKGTEEYSVYQRILEQKIGTLERDQIRSTGYVVDTLEAAVWCLLTTDSYEQCVLKAVNLGEDTDTVAAVAGGLAGALYGLDAIPEKWLNMLLKRDLIEKMCVRAAHNWGGKK